MRIHVHHTPPEYTGYRAACVKSLFNVNSAQFDLDVNIPIDGRPWSLGVIVGPSGSGKTSIGRRLLGPAAFHEAGAWPEDLPIVEAIAPEGDWQAVTGVLSAVGLGSVPSWLRPYQALSNGEKWGAELARIVSEAPQEVVIDEFSSVVDRQIARIGAGAFAKAWRRTGGRAVLLSCHYDIIEWLQPDWTLDLKSHQFQWGCLQPRPHITLDIFQTDWRFWPMFEEHHYLKLPHMIAATNYVGFVGDQPVAHIAVSTRPGLVEARACRLVVLPEWQGAGVGLKFLNAVCDMWRRGKNRYRKPLPTLFHTSHPGLAAALRRRPEWCQVSAKLYGDNKIRSAASIAKSCKGTPTGYGGHFRAVQGFRYVGEGAPC